MAEAKGRVLGVDHADTVLAREALAEALYEQGRLQEAAADYGEVAALRAATVGADPPDTRRARDWQADIQQELDGPDQANVAREYSAHSCRHQRGRADERTPAHPRYAGDLSHMPMSGWRLRSWAGCRMAGWSYERTCSV